LVTAPPTAPRPHGTCESAMKAAASALTSARKLPRQVNSRWLDCPGENGLGRNVSGGTRPRLSWGRSEL
jgi:hypothetical protein